ncbi:Transposase and inactivated derivatives [uncultured Flavonifractor sp.]|nr:Transposase and inactivated derivatives [uncultured Flavonifractor sp.]
MDLTEIKKIIAGLSKEDLQQLKNVIDETLIGGIDFKAFMVQVIEQKFSDGLICPRCHSKHIIKNGFTGRKVQRYLCKDCGGFVPTTKTVFANSKLSAGI